MKYKVVLTKQADTDAEDETVTVIRVMYGGMDIDKQLKKINK